MKNHQLIGTSCIRSVHMFNYNEVENCCSRSKALPVPFSNSYKSEAIL